MKLALCVPTLNAGRTAQSFLHALASQSRHDFERLVVDSKSDDNTIEAFASAGFRVHTIPRKEFNHGGTRQLALDLCPDAEVIIFLTQDAVLVNPDAIQRLVDCFADPTVGATYGRQLPARDASPISKHARLFNYPSDSRVASASDIISLGMKAAFLSNSFAAYRREALQSVGGFPSDVIFGEDTCVAAKMLQNNWKITYCSDAKVWHSHNYSLLEEFRRYFDIGVFHSRESWFLKYLGRAEGEGKKFVVSEIKYLSKTSPCYILIAMSRTLLKYAGYRIGLLEKYVPTSIKRRLSMNKGYWH
jgi:rhamnosyltransferase